MYVLLVAGMTNGKTKWKVFLEVGSTLQGVSTFLFLGKIPPHKHVVSNETGKFVKCIRSC